MDLRLSEQQLLALRLSEQLLLALRLWEQSAPSVKGCANRGADQLGWLVPWEELPSTSAEGTSWSEDTVYVVEQAAAPWLSRSQVDVRGAFREFRPSS